MKREIRKKKYAGVNLASVIGGWTIYIVITYLVVMRLMKFTKLTEWLIAEKVPFFVIIMMPLIPTIIRSAIKRYKKLRKG